MPFGVRDPLHYNGDIMLITRIAVQKKNTNRVNLYADGKYYQAMDRLVAMKLGLKPGLTLTPGLLDRIDKDQSASKAWDWALKSLENTRKSSGVLRDKLRVKFGRNIAESTVTKLETAGILDDRKYAVDFVESKLRTQLKSRRQLIALLKQKKIPDDYIQEAMEKIDPETDVLTARKLAEQKNRQLNRFEWEERREKIIAYLGRRGYNYSVIKQIIGRDELNSE